MGEVLECFDFNFYSSISFLLDDDICQILFRPVKSYFKNSRITWILLSDTYLKTPHSKDKIPNQATPCWIKFYAVMFGISKTPMLALSPHSQLSFHSARKKKKKKLSKRSLNPQEEESSSVTVLPSFSTAELVNS